MVTERVPEPTSPLPESLPFAHRIVDAASEHKAADIVLLDVHKATYIADYFVICSATSERHLNALNETIRDELKKEGIVPFQIEGTADSGWILVDYGDVILHLFSEAERDYYRLERVWPDSSVVLHVL